MKNYKTLASIAAIATLAACGSSGSGDSDQPDVTPQASTGFAVAGETDRANVTFTIRQAPSYNLTGDFSENVMNGLGEEVGALDVTVDTFNSGSENVSIAFNDDETAATLTIDGQTYALERLVDPDDPDAMEFGFADEDAVAWFATDFVQLGTDSEIVTSFVANKTTNTTDIVTVGVLGFDTDPAFIDATIGSTTYTGNALIVGSNLNDQSPDSDPDGPETGFDGIEGAVSLTANFDDQVIGGTVTFTNDPFDDEPLLTEEVTFEDTAISGNGFTGTMSSDDTFFVEGSTFGDMTYDGNFYGAEAENIAGTISGEILVEGADPIQTLGVFGANDGGS